MAICANFKGNFFFFFFFVDKATNCIEKMGENPKYTSSILQAQRAKETKEKGGNNLPAPFFFTDKKKAPSKALHKLYTAPKEIKKKKNQSHYQIKKQHKLLTKTKETKQKKFLSLRL